MVELIEPNNWLLNLRSAELSQDNIIAEETQKLIYDMLALANGERDPENPDRKSLVGLAAPQVGKLLRIIIVDMAASPDKPNYEPQLEVFINPSIKQANETEELGREGCYSTGNICGRVWRSKNIIVEALDRNGNSIKKTIDEPFQARIFQHEIDHLDGIRFPQRIRKAEDLHIVEADEFGAYRTEWKTWDKLATWDEWLDVTA